MACIGSKAPEIDPTLDSFVSTVNKKGIKLLAMDFDKTLVDIHTGGSWKESTDKLIEHVRPCMRDLVVHAYRKGIHVCIVTFNKQAWLIRELLQKVLPKKIATKVIVQSTPRESDEQQESLHFLCKEPHIAAVVNELYAKYGIMIKSKEILLLDDEMDNLYKASNFNHHAFFVPQNVSYDTFASFERMLNIKS